MKPFTATKVANARLNEGEYNEGATLLHSLPRALFIELTRGCNLTCPMCRTEKIPSAGLVMAAELFDAVAETLFPTAELVDLRGWGESLILPEIRERMATVTQYGARLRLVTNLSFRRDDILKALAANQADTEISLDTSDPTLLKFLRGGADHELILRNIRLLIEAYGHPNNLRVLVTVQRPAIASLPQLIQDVARAGIRRVIFFSVSASDDSELGLRGQDTQIDEAIQRCGAIAKDAGVTLTMGTKLGTSPDNPTGLPACLHPWAYCYIAYDGKVGFCDHLIGPSNAEYLIGDLTLAPFIAAWNSEGLQRIRAEHTSVRRASAPQFKHCAWCYKEKHVDFEYTFDSRQRQHMVFAPGSAT